MDKENSAGSVIFIKKNEIKYLLLQYEEGHWDFPKGNIEEGETEEEATYREVKEETGIDDIEIIQGFKENIHYFYMSEIATRKIPALGGSKRTISEHAQKPEVFDKSKGKLISKKVVFYLAETKKAEIKLSSEHINHIWLSFEEAMKKLTFENAKNVLKKADKFLKKNPI